MYEIVHDVYVRAYLSVLSCIQKRTQGFSVSQRGSLDQRRVLRFAVWVHGARVLAPLPKELEPQRRRARRSSKNAVPRAAAGRARSSWGLLSSPHHTFKGYTAPPRTNPTVAGQSWTIILENSDL